MVELPQLPEKISTKDFSNLYRVFFFNVQKGNVVLQNMIILAFSLLSDSSEGHHKLIITPCCEFKFFGVCETEEGGNSDRNPY